MKLAETIIIKCVTVSTCHSHIMDEVLHFGLQAKPLELDRDQFVSAHPWAVSFTSQLFLFGEQQKNGKTYNPSELTKKQKTQKTVTSKTWQKLSDERIIRKTAEG